MHCSSLSCRRDHDEYAEVTELPMIAKDLIGKRGETIAWEHLLDFCGNPSPYFDPHPLGEKCPTFDYLVELIGAGASTPYFLAQVKTTKQGHTKGAMDLKVKIKAKYVQMMVRCPIPTYLIGVDEPAARAYIVSIHGGLSRAISSMPTTYPLDCDNLKRLWDEVRTYWQSLGVKARSKTSVFSF
jgi:Domain of unknown function (DUF4365)